MNLTIGKRIGFGFGISVAITVAVGTFAYVQTRHVSELVNEVAEASLPGVKMSASIESLAKDCRGYRTMHLLAETPAEMEQAEKDLANLMVEIDTSVEEFRVLVPHPEEQRMIASAKEALTHFRAIGADVIRLKRSGDQHAAMAEWRSKALPAFKAVLEVTQEMKKANFEEGLENAQASADKIGWMQNAVLISVAAALVVASVLGVLIITGITRTLSRLTETLSAGADQSASAASQISSASQSLAQGASEQAAGLEETSANLEEISSMTRKNADSAAQANTLASEAKAATEKGNVAMAKMSAAIAQIEKSAADTSRIIKVIDEIAFQTNLLALNAAVEAARAGESGKGFAVVADEVRNLAMRSAEAAKNTSNMIEQSVVSARGGVVIATEVGERLAEISNASQKVSALIQEIAAASNEQAQGIGQVNSAVSQMEKVVQQNAAAAEESAAASEEMTAQSTELTSVVNELVHLVGGAVKSAAVPASRSSASSSRASVPKPLAQAFSQRPSVSSKDDFSDFNIAA